MEARLCDMVEPSVVGIRSCMKCSWKFVSPDVLRIGRCQDCKHGESSYAPRTASVSQVSGAVRTHLLKDTS